MNRIASYCFPTLAFLIIATVLPGTIHAADAGKPVANIKLPATDGKKHALYDFKDQKAIVVVFLSFECPVSSSYAPLLAEMHAKYGSAGVSFIGINSSDDLDAAQMAKQAAENKIPFLILKDADHTAAEALGATITPQAIVLDGNFVVKYRGRIDDSWSARLKQSTGVTHHDLRDALEAVLAGKAVAEPTTKAIGCPIPRDAKPEAKTSVTFYRDVLPILQERCQQCHRPGEVGPFSLMNYEQAVRWADDIKEYTQSHKMPPWKPVAGVAFQNERKMTDKELATLAAWAEGGTPEGNAKDAPQPRKFADGWQLGQPDLILTAPEEMTVGANGSDLFRCFVLPTNLTEDKYVVAFEVRPGNNRVVHHTLNFIDHNGQGRKLEKKEQERVKDLKEKEKDFGPGYTVAMGVGFVPQGGLGGWAPGQLARVLPDNTAYPLAKDSDVVIQVHYHRTGKVEKDRISLGLYFAKKPVAKTYKTMIIRGRLLMIPPGNPHYGVQGGIDVEQDCRLYSIMPHMHKLGREIAVTLTPPDGKQTTLLAIKDWDYNWQETYLLKEPIDVKAGTKVQVEAFYDNSANNPDSPSHGKLPVFFGEQTTNEMCFIFLGATSDTRGRIHYHQEKAFKQSKPGDVKTEKDKTSDAKSMDTKSMDAGK